ncbi:MULTISPECIES: transposase [unclassified Aeromonas]
MKSREHYSPEFRAEAVRLVLEQGLGQGKVRISHMAREHLLVTH